MSTLVRNSGRMGKSISLAVSLTKLIRPISQTVLGKEPRDLNTG
jgi:hypothetical protein